MVDIRTSEFATSASISDRPPLALEQIGLAPLPLTDDQLYVPTPLQSAERRTQPVANEQSVRLRESARLSLRNAERRLRLKATYSAEMYARETLRSIVAMQDAKQGGNTHAKQLTAALNAIRESRDFGVRFGAIDGKVLTRMVSVHETTTLKNRDLENLSAIEASEAYLTFALENLVQAAEGAPEASDALVILGMVERDTASIDNAHAKAIAVTLQRAAVQIAPSSMIAHRELGTTLGRQGLVDQAADSLKYSLAIRPTRIAYQRLLEVASRSGDRDTAQSCVLALNDESLPIEFAVRTIAPKEFAATHRPSLASVQSKKTESTVARVNNESNGSQPVRVSFRSLLPFGRK